MKTTSIRLKKVEIESLERCGGPTFRPISEGRYRCNQLPHLGKLTKGQVDYVRQSCFRPRPGAKMRAHLKTAERFGYGKKFVWCPGCYTSNFCGGKIGTVTCTKCYLTFRAV